jgi:hypothetical protein
MTLTELFLSQIADPFRIGLLIALLATTERTAQAMGRLIPLAAGMVFVAALIPLTIARGAGVDAPMAIGVGIVANAVILAVLLAVWTVYLRLRG